MDTSLNPSGSYSRPAQKRRRPALACEQCRFRKVRCDRAAPCSTCVRTGHPDCTYLPTPPPRTRSVRSVDPHLLPTPPAVSSVAVSIPLRAPQGPSNALLSGHVGLQTSASPISPSGSFSRTGASETGLTSHASSVATIDSLERRVKQLEDELRSAKNHQRPSTSWSPQLKTSELPVSTELAESSASTKIEKTFLPLPIRGTISKTRFFGQSHWANGANSMPSKYKMLLQLMDRAEHEKSSKIYDYFQKCKALARVIKARRVPSLPGLAIGQNVPDRPVADSLIDGYLRTFETVYRVLHVPSFKAEYQRYWQNPEAAGHPFVVLMQLCMAIGACFYDDTHSYRTQATRWVYEAKLWLMTPPEKSRLTIAGLQIMCLVQLAKQTAGISGDLTWISAGSLVRSAILMGLNHDPSTLVRMSAFRAEMRRRLWATILEINLQSSLDAGALPLISPSEYDTQPPANFSDEELLLDQPPSPKPNSYTQTTIQIALLKSLPIRHAIINHINNPHPQLSYEETLRLSAALQSATRTLFQRLHFFPSTPETPSTTSFQQAFLHHILARHLLTLHTLFHTPSPVHHFSRTTAVAAAKTLITLHRASTSPDFTRLYINASGPFRSTPVHACLALTLEYIALREEEDQDQALVLPNDKKSEELREIIVDWQTELWMKRIKSGETNIKAYAFGQVLGLLIDVVDKQEDVMGLIMEEAMGRVKECGEMLKELAGEDVGEQDGEEEIEEEAVQGAEMGLGDFDIDFGWIDGVDGMGWDEGGVGVNSFDLFFK